MKDDLLPARFAFLRDVGFTEISRIELDCVGSPVVVGVTDESQLGFGGDTQLILGKGDLFVEFMWDRGDRYIILGRMGTRDRWGVQLVYALVMGSDPVGEPSDDELEVFLKSKIGVIEDLFSERRHAATNESLKRLEHERIHKMFPPSFFS